jgi:hypothetical protein
MLRKISTTIVDRDAKKNFLINARKISSCRRTVRDDAQNTKVHFLRRGRAFPISISLSKHPAPTYDPVIGLRPAAFVGSQSLVAIFASQQIDG